MISADEYTRLKRRDRQVLPPANCPTTSSTRSALRTWMSVTGTVTI